VQVDITSRRRVAHTDLSLPPLGLGGAHLGELYRTVPEPEAQGTLEAAWDAGIRYFDTAPWYGRGLSEHRIGGFLRTRPRDQFAITTKVGRVLFRPQEPTTFNTAPWTGGLPFDLRFDYGYDAIMRSYEDSLQRLALNTVDALLIHDLDAAQHPEGAMPELERTLVDSGYRALDELKRNGDIKAIGMGINTDVALTTTATLVDLDFVLVAMPYTLLEQGSLDSGMALCLERGVSVIIGAPFASGILVTGSGGDAKYGYVDAPAEVQARVRGIEAVCAAHHVPLPAAALQFPLAHPAVVSVIPGAASAQEVEQNVASLQTPIPEAFWADLKDRALIHPDAPTPAA
jgi:D-threo-aldose 1-dehydrogenase